MPSRSDLWGDHESMQLWLNTVFDTILATPTRDFAKIDVPPYRFIHDSRNLLSVSLLSFASLRAEGAKVSKQDFEYLFCDVFLSYFDFPDDEGELFVSWVSTMIIRVAEEEERLDYMPADFIRDHLQYQARHDPILGRLGMRDRSNYITLFVSGLFAIHIGGLWSQLFDRIDVRGRLQLRPQFKLIEMFLNRFAEQELRFRAVTLRDVKEAMLLLDKYGVAHPRLEPKEEAILSALRFSSGRARQSFTNRARSAASGAMGALASHLPGSYRQKKRKRTLGVPNLELDEVA